MPPKKKAKKKAKAKAKRGVGFTQQELFDLFEIMEEVLPIGAQEWEVVASRHQEMWPDTEREAEGLKRKYRALANTKMPSGDPNCPVEVQKAKRLKQLIREDSGLSAAESDSEGTEDTRELLETIAGNKTNDMEGEDETEADEAEVVGVTAGTTDTTDTTDDPDARAPRSIPKRSNTGRVFSSRSRRRNSSDTNENKNQFDFSQYMQMMVMQREQDRQDERQRREQERRDREQERQDERHRQNMFENMMMMMFANNNNGSNAAALSPGRMYGTTQSGNHNMFTPRQGESEDETDGNNGRHSAV